MIRFIFGLLFSVLLAAPATAQLPICEGHSAQRGQAVQHYVPKAMACVEGPTAGFWFDKAIEHDIFERVNAERIAAGLHPLALRAELLAPARVHSFDMAKEGFFAHRGLDGRTPYQRISALDRTLVQSEARENLASVSGDMDYAQVGELLHTLLMDSEGHRTNILAPNLTHMAIGLARTEKGAWVTQVFVRQDGTLDAPLSLAHTLGDPLAIGAQLQGREFASAVFQGARGREYSNFQARDVPAGDLQLLVLGVQRLDDRTQSTIKLNGPAISILH